MEDPIHLGVDSLRGEARRETALEQPGRKGEHRVGFIPKVRLWNCWHVKMRSCMDDGAWTEIGGFAPSRLHRSVLSKTFPTNGRHEGSNPLNDDMHGVWEDAERMASTDHLPRENSDWCLEIPRSLPSIKDASHSIQQPLSMPSALERLPSSLLDTSHGLSHQPRPCQLSHVRLGHASTSQS